MRMPPRTSVIVWEAERTSATGTTRSQSRTARVARGQIRISAKATIIPRIVCPLGNELLKSGTLSALGPPLRSSAGRVIACLPISSIALPTSQSTAGASATAGPSRRQRRKAA